MKDRGFFPGIFISSHRKNPSPGILHQDLYPVYHDPDFLYHRKLVFFKGQFGMQDSTGIFKDQPLMITKNMDPLEIVEKHPETEVVFRKYDAAIGKCLLCHCLFDPLEVIAASHHFPVDDMVDELNRAIRPKQHQVPDQDKPLE